MGKKAGWLFVILLTSVFTLSRSVQAQTFSSYSLLGIGDISESRLAPQDGMGGLGLSNSNVFYGNVVNPALIADNSFYSFAAGFIGEDKTINQGDNSERVTGGTLSYLNAVYPIVPAKISIGLGLSPFTRVKYDFGTFDQVSNGAQSLLVNEGRGGFNQFSFLLGYNPFKTLYIGGRINYIFSSIVRESSTILISPEGLYNPVSTYRISANDFTYQLGAAYKYPLTSNIFLNIGGTYQFASNLTVIENQTVERRTLFDVPLEVDTLLEDQKNFYQLPQFYGVGISVKKITNTISWMIGSDLRIQKMGDFRDLNGENEVYRDALLITVGGEITPDVSNVENYFARVTYRAGFNYNQTPYFFNNTQIDEFGINFGFSLPVTSFSSVDIGLRYGSRGTLDDNFIKEDFLRFSFGVTFNDGRWFQRPKFN